MEHLPPERPSPTAAKKAAYDVTRDIFFRIGYDITDADDLRRLADDLRWASEKREASEQRSLATTKTFWVLVAGAVGPVVTLVFQWIVKHFWPGGSS